MLIEFTFKECSGVFLLFFDPIHNGTTKVDFLEENATATDAHFRLNIAKVIEKTDKL